MNFDLNILILDHTIVAVEGILLRISEKEIKETNNLRLMKVAIRLGMY